MKQPSIKALQELVERIDRDVDYANGQIQRLTYLFFSTLRAKDIFPSKPQNKYVLFSYPQATYERDGKMVINIGDYVQTLAVKSALSRINRKYTYEYWDRDNLLNYASGNKYSKICIMQGFFPGVMHAFPNKYIFPIFIGFHLGASIALQYTEEPTRGERVWRDFIRKFPAYFKNKSVGCRDNRTAAFLRSLGVNAYLSRCLSLTLPLREREPAEPNIYISCFPHVRKVVDKILPREMRKMCVISCPEYDVSVYREKPFHGLDSIDFMPHAEEYIRMFENKATLVITDRVHVAAPCIAMGIPTVIIRQRDGDPRYDTFDGITPCYTLDEVGRGAINLNPQRPNIEPLKVAMLENLRLTIDQEVRGVDHHKELEEIRKQIGSYAIEQETLPKSRVSRRKRR